MGAFAALGDFNIYLLVVTAVSASICGDSSGYLLGRQVGRNIITWLSKKRRLSFISPQVLERSQEYFQRHGAWAILLSRCVVPAFGGSLNIIAGAEGYPYPRFLIYDAGGELVSATIPLILGYIFGVSWEAIGTLLTTISLFILALLIVAYLTTLLIRTLRRMTATRKAKAITKIEHISSSTETTYGVQKRGL
jgi:membrane-associated protein